MPNQELHQYFGLAAANLKTVNPIVIRLKKLIVMANPNHVEMLKKGKDVWNVWRRDHSEIKPDLSGADLKGINLYFRAYLHNVDLTEANLRNANLEGAILIDSILRKANLSGASLRKSQLKGADLRRADLSYTNLHRACINEADMRGVDLTGSSLDVKDAHKCKLNGAIIKDLRLDRAIWAIELGSFLELAAADGLGELHPSSQPFIVNYITKAFEFAHRKDTDEAEMYPGWVEYVIRKIKPLAQLYFNDRFPSELVQVVQLINTELIECLKRNPAKLYKLNWRVFEELIAELLSSFGWEVQLTKPSKDGGYDIFGIYRDISGTPHTWIIECKKWAKDRRVGVDVVRALYGLKTDLRVGSAMLATTSHFTKGVVEFRASRYDFEIKDYEGVVEWLNAYHKNPSGKLYIKNNRLVLPG